MTLCLLYFGLREEKEIKDQWIPTPEEFGIFLLACLTGIAGAIGLAGELLWTILKQIDRRLSDNDRPIKT